MGSPQIDLTAGLVPKGGGIDLSAGLKAKTAEERPEGFWHSFGSMVHGMLEQPGPGAVVDPRAVASMVNSGFTALRQASHPISPETGLPIPDPSGNLRNLHMAAGLLAPVGGTALEKGLEQVESANWKGAAGTAAGIALPALAGRIVAPRAPTTPTAPTEALASFIDDRGGAVNPHSIASDIHPALKNQAALDKLDLSQLKGREVGQAVLKTVKNTVNAHQAEVATITKPYENVMVDQSPIAEAYLARRTPELIRNDAEAAARLMTEARKYADVDNSGNIIAARPAPLSDVNALRIRLNNETAAAQGKAEGAYRKTDWETQADVKAVEAAREVQYGNLAKVSGLDESYIRSLQRREGQLMETRDSLTKEFNKVSGQQAEAVAGSLRANPPGSGRFLAAVREKIGHTYPSRHGAERTLLRETIAPDPIDTFNNRLKLAFSNLGEGTPAPTYEQVPGAGARAKPTIQPPTPPTSSSRLTPEQVRAENAAYTQARSELGANAAPAQVQARAQQLKSPQSPQSQLTLGPGAEGLSGTTRSISRSGEHIGNIDYSISGDTLTINQMTTKAGVQAASDKALGRPVTTAAEMTPSEQSVLVRQLAAENPGLKYIQAKRVGGARGDEGRDVRIPIDRFLRTSPSSSPTLTQKVQALPLPRLRQIQSPRNPSTNVSPARAQRLAGPDRAQAIAATMTALKRGEITQREADRQIQRARGGGSGKLIRMPQNPG